VIPKPFDFGILQIEAANVPLPISLITPPLKKMDGKKP